MANKFNSEFNYRYQVQGETVWEKIKTLKGFLEGRVRAAEQERVGEKKLEAKREDLKNARKIGALPAVILNLEAELIEAESWLPAQKEGFELNRQEICILQNLLDEYRALAEPSRLPGHTDEEMFEANAANEYTATIAKDILAEIIANGRASPAKIRNAMSHPATFRALQGVGLIPATAPMLECGDDPLKIELRLTAPKETNETSHPQLH